MYDRRPTAWAATRAPHVRPRSALLLFLTLLGGVLFGQHRSAVEAAFQQGGNGNQVLVGRDNDNAANAFIQPPGVNAKQHLDNTDLLDGGNGDDLLIGLLGADVVTGGNGSDILIGGVENFQAPNSDVLWGGNGNDINIWAPGDGSDAFVGDAGQDVHIFAPLVVTNNQPALFAFGDRQIPRVTIANQPRFRCTIERVPAQQGLGFDFITRFFAGGQLAVTVRLEDVETVLCTSPRPNRVLVATLTSAAPTTFVELPLDTFRGTLLGAILQAGAR